MIDIKRILCPIDLSDASQHALEHAVAAAKWFEAHITLLHVYGTPQFVPAPEMPGYVPLVPSPEPEDTIEHLTERVRRFCSSVLIDRSVEILVRKGDPAKEIVRLAEQIPADLLVMGTHGRGGFERLFLGSVTEKVLRSTPSAVLTVPPRSKGPTAGPILYRRILCPIDFSDAATRALQHALSIARHTSARLTVLHVVEDFVDAPQLDVNVHFTVPEYRRYLEEDAIARLKAAVPDEARTWGIVEEQVTAGKASREILRVAAAVEAELIVMGVQGRGAVDRWVFGSTTHRIVREATCPVLTLRAASGEI